MNVLAVELRKRLERGVSDAREVAEAGARAALEALAVHLREPYEHMSAEERSLRRRLRAHGRQLGDRLDPRSGTQAIDRLVHECAYERWHGMLFARFLAENNLLIAAEWGDVSVSLKECEDLGKAEGLDKWAMAARFAHQMLPQVFRPAHPALEVRFAREHRLKLEELIESLPADIFVATDALGWVYQFWQSKKKDEVNRSGVKIGADELPAVTQLFTEPYMVAFLLDNTLGAWWAARRLSDDELSSATSELELRRKAAIPGVLLEYLRFVRHGDPNKAAEPQSAGADTGAGGDVTATESAESPTVAGSDAVAVDPGQASHLHEAKPGRWHPAAGSFDRWPESSSELRILDPCCGSGHFLVAAFSMLVPMRMELEGLPAHDAVDAVLRENLHGLELDARCVEVAAFALALAAWTYPGAEGYRILPEMNLACSGLAPNATKEQWSALSEQAAAAGGLAPDRDLFGVDDTLLSAPLRSSMESLHSLFGQAPVLGSLIDPNALDAGLFQRDFASIRELFAVVLEQDRTSNDEIERAVAARGMARAAQLLSERYTLVITNVPYLLRRKQSESLSVFCQRRYPYSKNDLATVFLERCLHLCAEGVAASLVLPQNWLFLTTYQKLRESLLKSETWLLLARLGPGVFETISGEVVKVILLALRHNNLRQKKKVCGSTTEVEMMSDLDVSDCRVADGKSTSLRKVRISRRAQQEYLKFPRQVIAVEVPEKGRSLAGIADYGKGSTTGDGPRFLAYFWEYFTTKSYQVKWLNSPSQREWSGRMQICKVPLNDPDLNSQKGCRLHGQRVFGRFGVAVNKMNLKPFLYAGEVFDDNVCPIAPKNSEFHAAIWCYVQSNQYRKNIRVVDPKLNVTAATLTQVPFDLERWTNVANERYPNGLSRPYSDDPTQWIFHGHPCGSVIWDETQKQTVHGSLRTDPTVLHVAVARLLGYRWPAELDNGVDLADEQREWVRRTDALLEWMDEDGIVCIPSVRGEPLARDRLLDLLYAAFGDSWNDGVLSNLLAHVGSSSLDDWLRNRFFDEHCKFFHDRPFIWHIWDGRRHDGFHALVNYHKLAAGDGKGRQLLESLTYSYLGDWIARQRDAMQHDEVGAEDRLVAACKLKRRLEAIHKGGLPFDIFVRWKPLHEQPIGWEPDINDGVRLNIRPFMAKDIPGGKKGAGILRAKPKISWKKDRGKEVLRPIKRSKPPWLQDDELTDVDEDRELRPREDYPWFWSCPGDGPQAGCTDFLGGSDFDGNRWNDLHYTNATKRAARERTSESRRLAAQEHIG